MYQNTLKDKISFSGIGIHSGLSANIIISPANDNQGISFIRTDVDRKISVLANFKNVSSTIRSTNLKYKNIEIHTVEHLLAALYYAKIDNATIEIDNLEVPILDGSSDDFVKEIKKVGIKQLNTKANYFIVKEKMEFSDKISGSHYLIEPSEKYSINTKISYKDFFFKNNTAILEDINNFEIEIASSRTFCFLDEIEFLIQKNLIKGGDLNNAVVFIKNNVSESLKNLIFEKYNISIKENSVLNNKKLRFSNEPARHKILDIIGDFSLLNKRFKGKITSFKPGHKNNIACINYIDKIMRDQEKKIGPQIDLSEKPFYNTEDIKKILPHREPFLFIDEIRELGEDYIIGVKYVQKNEDYFRGHFPKEPVMPGVLQLETMAQAGGVLILSTVENPQDYLTFFMKIDNAKFKQKVIPGDTIIFKLELISPIRRGLCHMHGKGYVNNKIVVEADLLAQIAKKQ